MQKLVTAKEMREMDQRTIKEIGVAGLLLMENAGLGIVQVVEEMVAELNGNCVAIFCGKGNNGGDGMVVARHLHNHGIDVKVLLVGEKEQIKGDARTNFW